MNNNDNIYNNNDDNDDVTNTYNSNNNNINYNKMNDNNNFKPFKRTCTFIKKIFTFKNFTNELDMNWYDITLNSSTIKKFNLIDYWHIYTPISDKNTDIDSLCNLKSELSSDRQSVIYTNSLSETEKDIHSESDNYSDDYSTYKKEYYRKYDDNNDYNNYSNNINIFNNYDNNIFTGKCNGIDDIIKLYC